MRLRGFRALRRSSNSISFALQRRMTQTDSLSRRSFGTCRDVGSRDPSQRSHPSPQINSLGEIVTCFPYLLSMSRQTNAVERSLPSQETRTEHSHLTSLGKEG